MECKFEEITSDYNYINKVNTTHEIIHYNSREGNFMEAEKQVESWLTEVEIKLIGLRPYTSRDDEECQLMQLKELNSEIKGKSSSMEMLTNLFSNNSSMKAITIHANVEELNERYEQVCFDIFITNTISRYSRLRFLISIEAYGVVVSTWLVIGQWCSG